jgi:peptide/nickel transport system ATP-binding protein
LSNRQRRHLYGNGLALIPQDPITALNPVRRIESQMIEMTRLHLSLDASAARQYALEMLHQVQIRMPERVLRLYPHELSGGMRQRVLIAIAFSCRPRLIVADEPTTALDVTVQRQILRLIKELQTVARTSLMFVTHDLGVVSKICDQVTVIHSGRVLESQAVEPFFSQPQHRYTQALFEAIPRYDRPGDQLHPVPSELTQELLAQNQTYDQQAGAYA